MGFVLARRALAPGRMRARECPRRGAEGPPPAARRCSDRRPCERCVSLGVASRHGDPRAWPRGRVAASGSARSRVPVRSRRGRRLEGRRVSAVSGWHIVCQGASGRARGDVCRIFAITTPLSRGIRASFSPHRGPTLGGEIPHSRGRTVGSVSRGVSSGVAIRIGPREHGRHGRFGRATASHARMLTAWRCPVAARYSA